MVCMQSSTGCKILLQRPLPAIQIPKGIPSSSAMPVEESTRARVCMVSSQNPIP